MGNQVRIRVIVAGVIFLVAAVDMTTQRTTARVHNDEPVMLNRGFMAGRLYRDYLRTGICAREWDSKAWFPAREPLGKAIVGLGLWLGGAEPPAVPYDYQGWRGYRWNLEHGRLPPPEVLSAGRLLIPLFSAAATTLIFVLGASIGGVLGGLLAAVVFQLNPVCRFYGPCALADMPAMFFTLLALCYLERRVAPAWDRGFRALLGRSVLFGLLAGLATATKLNSAIVVCVAVVAFAVWGVAGAAAIGLRSAFTRTLVMTMTVGVTSYGLFVLVNPQLHRSPVARTLDIVSVWSAKNRLHMSKDPGSALPTVGERAKAVGRVVVGKSLATLPVPYVTGLLVLAGAIVLAWSRRPPLGWRDPPSVLLIWGSVALTVVALWIPMDWDRYHLPVIAVISVLMGALGRLPLVQAIPLQHSVLVGGTSRLAMLRGAPRIAAEQNRIEPKKALDGSRGA